MSVDTPVLDTGNVLHLAPSEDVLAGVDHAAPPYLLHQAPPSMPAQLTHCGRDHRAEGMTRLALVDVTWRATSDMIEEPPAVEVTTIRLTNPADATICETCRHNGHGLVRGVGVPLPALGVHRRPAIVVQGQATTDIRAGDHVDIITGPATGRTTVRVRP